MRVLGRPPFHDLQLTMSGELAYVGGQWVREVAFAGYAVPLQVLALVVLSFRGPFLGSHETKRRRGTGRQAEACVPLPPQPPRPPPLLLGKRLLSQGDFPAGRMLDGVPGVDPARKARLIEVGTTFVSTFLFKCISLQ